MLLEFRRHSLGRRRETTLASLRHVRACLVAGLVMCLGCVMPPSTASEGGTEGNPIGSTGAPEGDSSSGGRTPDPTDGPERHDACEKLEPAASAILQNRCVSCHGGGEKEGDFGDVEDPALLIRRGWLVPGDPEGSLLLRRIVSGEMPPLPEAAVPPSDISTLEGWVSACLFDDQARCSEQPFISRRHQIESMLDDLTTLDPDDFQFTRYLTLTHLYNAGYCDSDLDVFRAGLSKAINSTSSDPAISKPQAVDAARTVYRIDLRNYDWAPADPGNASGRDKWEVLVAASPYAMRETSAEAVALSDLTGADVPVLPADWVIHDAMAGHLYRELLDLPSTMEGLQERLGVEPTQSIAAGEAMRAGFSDSDVALNQRVVERHTLPAAADLYLWLTYDFEDNGTIEKDVFARPLGFDHDGNQILFTLPNGLHAFMSFDEHGASVLEVPTEVMADPDQRDFQARNAISCIGCHRQGVVFKDDEVRAFVQTSTSFDAETKDAVRELYVEGSVLAAKVDSDNQHFAGVIEELGDRVEGASESVSTVFGNFDQPLDLARAAGELHVEPLKLLVVLGSLHPQLERLGSGGTVTREVWQREYPSIVCVLNLGETDAEACEPEPEAEPDGGTGTGGAGG